MSELTLLSGTANRPLAEAIAKELGISLGGCRVDRFPDGEIDVELTDEVRARDVYLLQPTHPPVGEHLLELMLLADACRRAGARRVTALVPYVGLARQDRRVSGGEPVGARVMADIVGTGSIDRLVAMDLHSRAVEGCFRIPVEHVSAVEALAGRLSQAKRPPSVVVSPDLGAVKLAERYARILNLPVAVVHKQRLSGSEVSARGVMGDVRGLAPIVIDDMISTGGTIAAAIDSLLEAGSAKHVTVCATYSFLVGPAIDRLRTLPIERFLTTDAIPPPAGVPWQVEVVSVAPVMAEAVRRLRGG
jgi:ribose-phosphate pyrophosphokinase